MADLVRSPDQETRDALESALAARTVGLYSLLSVSLATIISTLGTQLDL